MLAGHFGLAAAVKAIEPKVPLWALMVSTQLLDIAFVPLLLTGVESIEEIGGGGYGEAIIHADYTHSLLGALLLSAISALLAWHFWNKRSAVVIGSLAFSHWLLDLLVHRSDMPILPGNIGHLPLLGLRLWELPLISAAVELILILIGAVMYIKSVKARSDMKQLQEPAIILSQRHAYRAGWVMAVLLILCFVSDYFSL